MTNFKILIFHQHFKTHRQAGSSRMRNLLFKFYDDKKLPIIITGASCRDGLLANENKFNFFSLVKVYKYRDRHLVISIQDFYSQKKRFFGRVVSFLWFAVLATIIGLLQGKNTKVVLASSTPLTIVIPAIIVKKIYSIRFVFEVRDLWPDGPIQMGYIRNKIAQKLLVRFERWAYQNSDSIIAHTKGVQQKISERTTSEVNQVPIGVDPEYYCESLREYNAAASRLNVIYAGACGHNNAIEVFISVAQLMYQDSQNSHIFKFQLVGEGPALEDLKYKVPSNVQLTGKLPKQDVRTLLNNSHIALFSQRKVESSDFKKDVVGNKYFDFIGAELPIVMGSVLDGEMAVEAKNAGFGLITNPEDIEELKNSLLRLEKNRELLLQMHQATKAVKSKYNQDLLHDKFSKIVFSNL